MAESYPVVLLACTSEGAATAKNALGPGPSYRVAHDVDSAVVQLGPDIDLILCNVAFDSSRMFDLVNALRSSSEGRIVPIICFRIGPLSAATRHALEVSLRGLERVSFLDLHKLSEEGGEAAASSALRVAVAAELRWQSAPWVPGVSEALKE